MALTPVIIKLDAPTRGRRNEREPVTAPVPAATATEAPTISGLRQAFIPETTTRGAAPRRTMSADDRANTEVRFRFEGREPITMRLGTLSPRNTVAAAAAVDAVAGDDVPSLSRTASILQTLAANESQLAAAPPPFQPSEVQVTRPMQARPRLQAARPMAAFRTAVAAEGLRATTHTAAARGDDMPTPPRAAEAPSPEIEVKIELEGLGVQTAYYHQVLELPNAIVLAWHTKWRGMRYLPPEGESAPKMALQAAGSRRIFLVHSTALHIPFQDYELTVLLLEQVVEQADEPGE